MMYYRISKNGKILFFGKKIAQVWAVTLSSTQWSHSVPLEGLNMFHLRSHYVSLDGLIMFRLRSHKVSLGGLNMFNLMVSLCST